MDDLKRFEAFRSRPTPETLVDLLRGCQDTVYNLCFQVLRHPQNAEDASQKVFMTILEQLPKISDSDHFRRWLRTVCLHVSLDLKRKQETVRTHAREAAERAVREPAAEGAEILEHLALLEGEQRLLIVEHYFDRRPLEEMAGTRGCSPVTVWNRLQKALDRLKKSLVEAGFERSAFSLDTFLLGLLPAVAPRDLITTAVAAKAASVPTSVLVAGGTAVKMKILGGIAAAGLLVLISVPIVRGAQAPAARSDRFLFRYQTGPREASATATATAVWTGPTAAEGEPERFAAIGDFTRALRKSLVLLNDGERWRALRKIGFTSTDEELVQVQSGVRFRRGTPAYAIAFEKLLIEAWTKRDPTTAASFFRDLPGTLEDPIKLVLMNAVLSAWRAPAAQSFAEALPAGAGRTRLLNRLAAFQDPAALAARVASMDAAERFKSMEDLAEAWPAVDPQSAVRWFSDQDQFLGRALARWAAADLAAALEWTLRLPAGPSREELVRQALLGGAPARPREASELAARLLNAKDPQTPSVMSAIASAWIERDVAEGLRIAEFFTERSVLLSRAAELDPAQALAWVIRRPAGEDPGPMIQAVFKGWALSEQTTPQKALEAARTLTEPLRLRAIEGLLIGMCDYDPAGACAFAAGLPASSVPFDALGERFAYQDLEAAASWARTLGEPNSRDQAIDGILRLAKNWHLGLAVSLAREMSTSDRRTGAYIQLIDWVIQVPQKGLSTEIRLMGVLSAWTTTDPGSAGPWVDQSKLSPKLKAEAYKVVGEPRQRPSSRR